MNNTLLFYYYTAFPTSFIPYLKLLIFPLLKEKVAELKMYMNYGTDSNLVKLCLTFVSYFVCLSEVIVLRIGGGCLGKWKDKN